MPAIRMACVTLWEGAMPAIRTAGVKNPFYARKSFTTKTKRFAGMAPSYI